MDGLVYAFLGLAALTIAVLGLIAWLGMRD